MKVAVDGKDLSGDLVCPVGIVRKRRRTRSNIASNRVLESLPVVHRLQEGEVVPLLPERFGELSQQATALSGAHFHPRAAGEGAAGGFDGQVHVGAGRGWSIADPFAGRGI